MNVHRNNTHLVVPRVILLHYAPANEIQLCLDMKTYIKIFLWKARKKGKKVGKGKDKGREERRKEENVLQ